MKGVLACLAVLAAVVSTQAAWADTHIDLSAPADYPTFDVGSPVDPGPNRALILCEYCNSLNNGLKFLKMATMPVTPMLVAALDSLQVFLVTRSGGNANLVEWKF
jgi:hypothetical protein